MGGEELPPFKAAHKGQSLLRCLGGRRSIPRFAANVAAICCLIVIVGEPHPLSLSPTTARAPGKNYFFWQEPDVLYPPPPQPVALSPPPPTREAVARALGEQRRVCAARGGARQHRHAAEHGCTGNLYRSEKDFLVQGRIDCGGGTPGKPPAPKVEKGGCPDGVPPPTDRKRCPSHDPKCGCHGPLMGKGMVGWAGGSAGPDFFVYSAHMDPARCAVGGCVATHWSHDHTVWAEVADDETWAAIGKLYALPVRKGGMTFFAKEVPISVGRTQRLRGATNHTRESIRIGVHKDLISLDVVGRCSWVLGLGNGRLLRYCRDANGAVVLPNPSLPPGFPDGQLTQVMKDEAGQPTDLRDRATGAVIEVLVDHDAGGRSTAAAISRRYIPMLTLVLIITSALSYTTAAAAPKRELDFAQMEKSDTFSVKLDTSYTYMPPPVREYDNGGFDGNGKGEFCASTWPRSDVFNCRCLCIVGKDLAPPASRDNYCYSSEEMCKSKEQNEDFHYCDPDRQSP
ncbi:hypothetical protein EMIHUDRAFT_113875 [Emiliania huxleyi CCMP1516]|uniref:Uncharacterized protein n=2 Tax=Emiliania huxleyi TaxID=2903 RepID=A0A0D3K001_EMIH1|nr:hypothetical protein EMIHUDRAFT_113875 [Emiliania huxleyi CCMP1516]EOD29086.1 hypothetical protein EMIHUDRAFT_113875 [Emiliania huxleyi CCMP1516]|eukprot:XP_005781515.1 hypothetical protein EMIHUDRAFT_113875 [Emiliania huxleyi CCMP1516]